MKCCNIYIFFTAFKFPVLGISQDTHPEWIPISEVRGLRVPVEDGNSDSYDSSSNNDSDHSMDDSSDSDDSNGSNSSAAASDREGLVLDGSLLHERSRRRALDREEADRVFYLGYDLYPRDNPKFHHHRFYSFDEVDGQNKLRTPQMNNVTLAVGTLCCSSRAHVQNVPQKKPKL